jgi:hypothetical protein
MNANLINTNHGIDTNTCALRNDLNATDHAVATPERTLPMLKTAMRFLLALTLLMGLMAARPAHAQGLYLPKFTNILTMTDASTKKSVTAYLDVTQDKFGNLGGDLVIGSTSYKITGTLTWDGASFPNWYWLNITATYNSGGWLPETVTYHLSDWVYVENSDTIEYCTSGYTYTVDSIFGLGSGSGTFGGIGFFIQ